jgi:phenylacetate-CoA ligase
VRGPAEDRGRKLRAVLLAALDTHFYRPLLESAELGTPESIAGLEPVEAALARLPRVCPPLPGIGSSALLNGSEPRGPLRELYWPLPPAASAAVLMEGFREHRTVKVFGDEQRGDWMRFAPEALAGPAPELRRLAELVESRLIGIPRPVHSVIAFSLLPQAFLSEEARDLFWRVFRVPVFAQILSPSCEVLAWECEAHQGYHVAGDSAIFEIDRAGGEPELLATSLVDRRRPVLRMATGMLGRVEHAACACGQAGPRLVEVRRKPLVKVSAAALSSSCATD